MLPDFIRFWGASPTSDPAFTWVFGILSVTYLVGSIPFGVLITKAYGFGNIREYGSGNIGATNVLRTGSRLAAFLTLLLDGGKGYVTVQITYNLFGTSASQIAAFGVFLGHIFSIFLIFRGGKGVATFLGLLLGLDFLTGFAVCAFWLSVAILTKYSSVASLLSSLFALIFVYFFGDLAMIWLIVILVLFIWIGHRKNLVRMFNGSESKIKLK